MRVLLVFPAILFSLMSCAALGDPSPPDHLLPHTELIIDSDAGPVKFDVEVAADWHSQEYGLMNRKALGAHAGMVFDFKSPTMTSFWMKNTLIPLDMLFIKEDGTISSIAPDAVPMSLTSIPSQEPIRAVLEIYGGEAAKYGIYPGAKVHNALFGNAARPH